jgi:hypothetical protein
VYGVFSGLEECLLVIVFCSCVCFSLVVLVGSKHSAMLAWIFWNILVIVSLLYGWWRLLSVFVVYLSDWWKNWLVSGCCGVWW